MNTIVLFFFIMSVTAFIPNICRHTNIRLNVFQTSDSDDVFNYPPKDRIQVSSNANTLPPFIYYEFEENEPTYLIIAKNNIRFQHLFTEMVKSRTNYVIIDIAYYTFNELIQVCEFYGYHPGTSMDVFEEPIVFLEDKEYIGGCFEMYEIIAKKM